MSGKDRKPDEETGALPSAETSDARRAASIGDLQHTSSESGVNRGASGGGLVERLLATVSGMGRIVEKKMRLPESQFALPLLRSGALRLNRSGSSASPGNPQTSTDLVGDVLAEAANDARYANQSGGIAA